MLYKKISYFSFVLQIKSKKYIIVTNLLKMSSNQKSTITPVINPGNNASNFHSFLGAVCKGL